MAIVIIELDNRVELGNIHYGIVYETSIRIIFIMELGNKVGSR